MKVAYFINTFKSTNWGGQATSNGIKVLLKKNYSNIEFTPLDLPDLPFKKNKLLRVYYNHKLKMALINNDEKNIYKYLQKMNISLDIFDSFTHICFNGEGAVHYKSGHLIRFMALLYLALKRNVYVAAINQTIDLNNDKNLDKIVSKVYNMCDFVSVREPISLRYAKNIGISKCKLIPDAVYGLEKYTSEEIKNAQKEFDIKSKYITITASSILKRNKTSVNLFKKVLISIEKVFYDYELVFMSNAKTDLYIAKKLLKNFNMKIITSDEIDYCEAIKIFAGSSYLIGGRQHPNIFAYIYNVPYLPFKGNTFKNDGVAELQKYNIDVLDFQDTNDKLIESLKKLKLKNVKNNISIDNFKIFDKESI